MKKYISAILVIILMCVFCACSDMKGNNTASSHPDTSEMGSEKPEGSSPKEETGEEENTDDTPSLPSEDEGSTPPVNPTPTPTPTPSNDPVKVSYPINAINAGSTFTGLPSLPAIEYTVNDPNNSRGLSRTKSNFSFGVARDGAPHSITVNNQKVFDSYNLGALAWDNKTQGKILYLTFDCGYKYGDLTSRMLDTLKEKNVKAAFFCTMDYLEDEPQVIARMINEGHIVGNHTTNHPDCTAISREKLAKELLGVDNYMRVNHGYETKYFRFPSGSYSHDALEFAHSVGYRSAFWSIAYADWDPNNQQGIESAFSQITSRLHPGAVILLHSTSPDNAEILGRYIDYAREQGYEFRTLDQYAYWT